MLTFKASLNEAFGDAPALNEAVTYMTDYDRKVKKALIKLLIDDGRGHHHAKYAERLKNFFLKVVPVNSKEIRTAAIQFETRVIYLNEGFLLNYKSDPKQMWPDSFYQLSTIIRHELLHNLLMHQIRMMKYLGAKSWSHISTSSSIHTLLNIIEDFEISNKKYTAEDKETVRNTWLNGKIISGLVTEDHRAGWQKMSVEQMYEEVVKELEKLKAAILSGNSYALATANSDQIGHYGLAAAQMFMADRPSDINGELEDFINNKTFIQSGPRKNDVVYFKDLNKNYQEIIQAIYDAIIADPNYGYGEKHIKAIIKQIGESNAIKSTNLVSPVSGEVICTVYTPEEKTIARMALNTILGYTQENVMLKDTYDRVQNTLSDPKYSDDDLQDILDALE